MTAAPSPTLLDPLPTSDVVVELFYVEHDGCEPCARAISETDDAALLLRDELAARGRHLTVRTVSLHEPGHAQALGIDNPVTVRVNGTDVSADASATSCGGRGSAPARCRSYEWDGQRFDAPPAELIVEAVHRQLGSWPS